MRALTGLAVGLILLAASLDVRGEWISELRTFSHDESMGVVVLTPVLGGIHCEMVLPALPEGTYTLIWLRSEECSPILHLKADRHVIGEISPDQEGLGYFGQILNRKHEGIWSERVLMLLNGEDPVACGTIKKR